MSESLLSIPDVCQRVGLSPSMIYRLVSQGQFPRPAKFGTRSLWIESEINAWIADRLALHKRGKNMDGKS